MKSVSAAIKLLVACWAVVFLSGCAYQTIASRGFFPEVTERTLPSVDLGPETVLLDETAKAEFTATGLAGNDGRVHLFVLGGKSDLIHLEILGDQVVKREVLGTVKSGPSMTYTAKQGSSGTSYRRLMAFDAIEYPRGTYRVIAGDRQYSRTGPDGVWEAMEGNRCIRFLRGEGSLLCAFVARGEEVKAPQRKDVTITLLNFVIPIPYWETVRASKLVVAQETGGNQWTIRAVLDPDTIMDGQNDFFVAPDQSGTLHFLYYAHRGGRWNAILVGPTASAWGGTESHLPELRYARFSPSELAASSKDGGNGETRSGQDGLAWLTFQGVTLPTPPYRATISEFFGPQPLVRPFRPLAGRFWVEKEPGRLSGLIPGRVIVDDDGSLKIDTALTSLDGTWVETGMAEGAWTGGFRVVALGDVPEKRRWSTGENIAAMKDSKDTVHTLLQGCSPDCEIYYLVRDQAGWSAPLALGKSNQAGGRLLVADPSGGVFAVWVDKEGRLTGRWIRSKTP